jgi:pyridoxamine 5'-phosphate oxidase
MCTDLRSRKVLQNQEQPVAEVVWWFPKTNEQYRIRGRLILVGQTITTDDRTLMISRKELWGNLSDPARESFLGSLVPGTAYDGDETAVIPEGGRSGEDGKPVPPPDNFLLMLLDPTHVDYLLLGRDQYRQGDSRVEGKWSYERLNP